MVFKIVLAVIFGILFAIWLILRKVVKGLLLDCKNGTNVFLRHVDPRPSEEEVEQVKEGIEKGDLYYKRLCAIFLINI